MSQRGNYIQEISKMHNIEPKIIKESDGEKYETPLKAKKKLYKEMKSAMNLSFLDQLRLKLFRLRLSRFESQKRSITKRILKAIDQNEPDDYIQGLRDKLAIINEKIIKL